MINMKKYLILFVMAFWHADAVKRRNCKNRMLSDQKAGFVRMAEGMKQNVDKYYVPDYAKAYAFADSAIAHSPDNPHFYSMKAVWYMWDGEYRKAVNIYQRLFGRGVFPAEQMYEAAQAYDSLHVMDSAAYFYRRALTAYREELDMLKNDTLSFEYEKAVSRIGRLEAMPGISE